MSSVALSPDLGYNYTSNPRMAAMADNNYTCLDLEKNFTTSADNPLDPHRSSRLREQLVAEIQTLEQKLAALQDAGDEVDFSLQQTCREMIHDRQQLYLKLRR